MRNWGIIVTVIGLTNVAAAVDHAGWGLPRPHLTQEREAAGEIRTVWPDLRVGGVNARPAMPLPDLASAISIDYQRTVVARNNQLFNDEGERQTMHLTWRQSFIYGVSTEMRLGVVHADALPNDQLTDLEALTVVRLSSTRYQSWALEFGVQYAITDGQDLDTNHNEAWQTPTFIGGVRFSTAVGFHVVTLNARGLGNWSAQTDLEYPQFDDQGNVTPPGAWDHRYIAGEAQISYSYRFLRQMRVGVEASPFVRQWSPEESGQATLSDYGMPTILFVQVTPLPDWLMLVGAGYDMIDPELRHPSAWRDLVVNASMQFVW